MSGQSGIYQVSYIYVGISRVQKGLDFVQRAFLFDYVVICFRSGMLMSDQRRRSFILSVHIVKDGKGSSIIINGVEHYAQFMCYFNDIYVYKVPGDVRIFSPGRKISATPL